MENARKISEKMAVFLFRPPYINVKLIEPLFRNVYIHITPHPPCMKYLTNNKIKYHFLSVTQYYLIFYQEAHMC